MIPPRWNITLVFVALVAAATAATSVHGQATATGTPFVRGDADASGDRALADALFLLGCLFLGSECPPCPDAADVDDDGALQVTDAVALLSFLFAGGASPPAPGSTCGTDPTDDELACDSYSPCDPDAMATASGPLLVTPVEHASLALRWNGRTLVADPAGGAARFAGLPVPDVIVVTDIHGDHLDTATLAALAGESTVLVVSPAVGAEVARVPALAALETRVLAHGETTDIAGIGLEAVPAYNITTGRLQYHPPGRGNGYVIDLAGTRVYVSGDTEDIPEMRALTGIDLAFLCMNLPFTMTPEQAASAALEFAPRVVYPYHYRGQDPEVFRSLVEAESSGIEVRIRDWYR